MSIAPVLAALHVKSVVPERGPLPSRKTPAEIIEKLNRETNAGLADADLEARLVELGGTLIPGSPVYFRKLIAGGTGKWGKVTRGQIESQAAGRMDKWP